MEILKNALDMIKNEHQKKNYKYGIFNYYYFIIIIILVYW